jgi:tetratricopeptide (TPR) repeat protein
MYTLLHRYDDALNELNKAIRLNPSRTEYRLAKAKLLIVTGIYEEALDECDQVLKRDPNNFEAHELKAEALEHLGKTKRLRGNSK